MMVPRSTIYKQKGKFFALVSVLLCLPPLSPIFHKTMPSVIRRECGQTLGRVRVRTEIEQ